MNDSAVLQAYEGFYEGMTFVKVPGVKSAHPVLSGEPAARRIRFAHPTDLINSADDGFAVSSLPTRDCDAETANGGSGVTIWSFPFKLSVPALPHIGPVKEGNLDHSKWVSYTEFTYPPPDDGCGEVLFQSCLSVQTFNTEKNPFGSYYVPDPQDDPRMAWGSLTTRDLSLLVIAQIALTNRGVYVVYQRLDRNRTPEHQYGSFSYLIRVADRTSEFVNVAIGWTKKRIRYYVEGVLVYEIKKIGRHLPEPDHTNCIAVESGGKDETVVPRDVVAGFNAFTFLDAYRPNRQAIPSGSIAPLVRLDSNPGHYLDPFLAVPRELTLCDFASKIDDPKARIFNSIGKKPTADSQGTIIKAKFLAIWNA